MTWVVREAQYRDWEHGGLTHVSWPVQFKEFTTLLNVRSLRIDRAASRQWNRSLEFLWVCKSTIFGRAIPPGVQTGLL